MSIVRIDGKRTHGWQARAYVGEGLPRITMLCSDAECGGSEEAHRVATAAEQLLQLQAFITRRGMAREALLKLKLGAR